MSTDEKAIAAQVIKIIRKASPTRIAAGYLTPDRTLADAGFDSMALMSLALTFERELGIDVNRYSEALFEVRTVRHVLDLVTRALGEREQAHA